MSLELARRAETLKLGRVLRVEPEQLAYLDTVDPKAIRALRERVSDQLFEGDRALFQRIVASNRLIPAGLAAIISEKALGPLLCARVSGLMPVDRAIEIANKLPTAFLARTCLLVDPHRARDLIRGFPVRRVTEIAKLLAGSGEHVAMARFVDSMSKEAIHACMDILGDEQLLSIGFFVEEKSRLNEIVGWLDEERLRSLVRTGAADAELRPQALSLMSEVDDRWKQRLGDIAVELGDEFIGNLAGVALEQNLWSALLPVVGMMSPSSQRRLLALPALRDDAMLVAILRAADRDNLWPALLPLLPLMDETSKKRMAALAEQLDDATFPRIAEAALSGGHIPALVGMLNDMNPAHQRRLMELPAFRDEAMMAALLEAADRNQLWPRLLPLLPRMDPAANARLATLAGRLGNDSIARIARSALEAGQIPGMLQLVQAMDEPNQRRLVAMPAFQDQAMLLALVQAADRDNLWPQLLPLSPLLDPPTHARLAGLAEQLDADAIRRIARSALDCGRVPELMKLVGNMCAAQRERLAGILQPLLPQAARTGS